MADYGRITRGNGTKRIMNEGPFFYQEGELVSDGVPLARIAAEVGTPVYVYSHGEWLRRTAAYRDAAAAYDGRVLVCYTLKANANPALLRLVAGTGLGADVTGGGELFLALRAGFAPEKIVFSGVGKMAHEMAEALSAGVKAIHVESAGELRVLSDVAAGLGRVAAVGVRLNPDVAAETHPHISTGRRAHKFGVAPDVALTLLRHAADDPWLRPVSLSNHIGSQIVDLAPFAEAAQILVEVADEAAGMGIRLDYIDMGGGLGIRYHDERPPVPADLRWRSRY
jgi:diaminopimelate decarboxylase